MWETGVKCRKITHGYCTLKIEPGLHKFKFKLHTGLYCTQDNTDITSPRIQIQINYMCLCT